MNRRSLLAGLFVAPAIVRTPGLLMPIKPTIDFIPLVPKIPWIEFDGLLTLEKMAAEMLAIMVRNIMPTQIEAMLHDRSGGMRTTLAENGRIDVKFIPGSEIYRKFYG